MSKQSSDGLIDRATIEKSEMNYVICALDPNRIDELFEIKEEVCAAWQNKFGLVSLDKEKFRANLTQVGQKVENVVCLKYRGNIVGFSVLEIQNTIGFVLEFPKSARIIPPIILSDHESKADMILDAIVERIRISQPEEVTIFAGSLWGNTEHYLQNYDVMLDSRETVVIYPQTLTVVQGKEFGEIDRPKADSLASFLHEKVFPEKWKAEYTVDMHLASILEAFDNANQETKYYYKKNGTQLVGVVKVAVAKDEMRTTHITPFISREENNLEYSEDILLFAIYQSKLMGVEQSYLPGYFYNDHLLTRLGELGMEIRMLNCYQWNKK